jgi:hypothetical protein
MHQAGHQGMERAPRGRAAAQDIAVRGQEGLAAAQGTPGAAPAAIFLPAPRARARAPVGQPLLAGGRSAPQRQGQPPLHCHHHLKPARESTRGAPPPSSK